MSVPQDSYARRLDEYREYFGLLVRLQLDARWQRKFDRRCWTSAATATGTRIGKRGRPSLSRFWVVGRAIHCSKEALDAVALRGNWPGRTRASRKRGHPRLFLPPPALPLRPELSPTILVRSARTGGTGVYLYRCEPLYGLKSQ